MCIVVNLDSGIDGSISGSSEIRDKGEAPTLCRDRLDSTILEVIAHWQTGESEEQVVIILMTMYGLLSYWMRRVIGKASIWQAINWV